MSNSIRPYNPNRYWPQQPQPQTPEPCPVPWLPNPRFEISDIHRYIPEVTPQAPRVLH